MTSTRRPPISPSTARRWRNVWRGWYRRGRDASREQLVAEAERRDIGRLWQSPDFYNMSGCRDLCFHVQEHRLTIPQIKTFLDDNGLRFIGFVVDPRSQNEVESRFPNEGELDRWHRYETEHQNMFSGQYHFWLQKPRRTAN